MRTGLIGECGIEGADLKRSNLDNVLAAPPSSSSLPPSAGLWGAAGLSKRAPGGGDWRIMFAVCCCCHRPKGEKCGDDGKLCPPQVVLGLVYIRPPVPGPVPLDVFRRLRSRL